MDSGRTDGMGALPNEEEISRIVQVFKVFGDNTRIKILWSLADKELCVYDIARAVGMSQSAVSHQLRILRQARLVRVRREGKNSCYSLDDEHIQRIIEQVVVHVREE